MKTLERRLGLPSVIAIAVGAMISGLFVLPGLAAAESGTSVWLAFLIAGVLVLPATLSKAELSTAMPVAGGTYAYIDRAFGPLAGTIAGVGLWISLLLKSSFALVGFGAYLMPLIDVPLAPTGLVLLAAVTTLNVLGVRKVGKVQLWVVSVALICLGGLSTWGFTTFDWGRLDEPVPEGGGGLLAAAALVYISYAGVTKVAAIAEEVKKPEINLPLGMLISLVMITTLYATVTLVLAGNLPLDELAGHEERHLRPIYNLAVGIGTPLLGVAAAALGVLTMTSAANSGMLAASRFPFAMSRDHLLPSFLAKIHERFHTPVLSIVSTASVMAVAIVVLDVERIAKLAGSAQIVAYMFVNVTVIVLRESDAQWYKPPWRNPFYPWSEIVGLVGGLVLLVMLGYEAVLVLLGMGIPGTLIFFLYARPRTERRGVLGRIGVRKDLLLPTPQTLEAALPGEAAVVVPVFGVERSPEVLVEVGAALADGKRVEVLHLTDVPEVVDVGVMLEDDPAVRSIERRVTAMAEVRDFDVTFDAVVTRDVVQTVNDVTSRVHCNWLLMEWGGRSEQGISLFNPLGWFVNHLPANLALFTDAGVRYTREILVVPEPGPNDALVVDTADHLATVFGARMTFVRWVSSDADDMEETTALDYLDELTRLCVNEPKIKVARGRREVDAIAEITGGYDLLVLGALAQFRLRDQIFGSTVDRITSRAACSVLRLKTPAAAGAHSSAVDREHLRHSLPGFEVADFIDPACVEANVPALNKAELLERIAESFAKVVEDVPAADILAALKSRESSQNTSVGHGVAMPHATIPEAAEAYLGVFVLTEPVEWEAADGRKIDVIFSTLGPPEERNTHLMLLSSLSRKVLHTDLLERLRAAEDADAVRTAFSGKPSVIIKAAQ